MPISLFPNAAPNVRAKLEARQSVALFNARDWSATALGPVSAWPESLLDAVRTMIAASIPMAIRVGEEGVLLYNDAYGELLGDHHPQAFGQQLSQHEPKATKFSRDALALGLAGESWVRQGMAFNIMRGGNLQTSWVDLHFSPIIGSDGRYLGILCVLHDATDRELAGAALIRSEERLSLALSSASMVGTWDWHVEDGLITGDEKIADMFGLDPQQVQAGLQVATYLKRAHPDDLKRLKAEIRHASQTLDEFRSEFRVVTAEGDLRWIMAVGRPYATEVGSVARFPGVAVDVSMQHETAAALAASETRFRTLANAMPQMVWSTTPDGRSDYLNPRWLEFTGLAETDHVMGGWYLACHEDDLDRVDDEWRRCIATGDSFQLEFRIRHHSGSYRWTLARALPVRGEGGVISQWIGTCTDIDDTKLAAQERDLVAQELSHRIKNLFAVINGIVSLSANSMPEARSFADQLRQRIYALGEAHDFVRPQSHLTGLASGEATLWALISRLMKPYEVDGVSRVTFVGEDTAIDDAAATPMALLVHELATNATKYGALSRDEGRIKIEGRNDNGTYRVVWAEVDGPEVSAPRKPSGFGWKLISLSVEGQLRGAIERHWKSDGLVVDLALPQESLKRSGRLQPRPLV